MQPIQLTFEAMLAIEEIISSNPLANSCASPADLPNELLEASLRTKMPYLAASTVRRFVEEWKTHFAMTSETCTAIASAIFALPPEERFDSSDKRALFEFMKQWFSGCIPVNREFSN